VEQQPIPARQQTWQFSLGSLMAAVASVALACAAGKYFIVWLHHPPLAALPLGPYLGTLSLFAIPVSLCGAVGVLRGQLKSWLAYGVVFSWWRG
jgi:hypothetical protein